MRCTHWAQTLDSEVRLEHDILLGPDDATAKQYVGRTHKRLSTNYLKAISKVETLERRMFGPNSFFLNNGVHATRDTGDLFEPEPDLSDEEEDVV
jgi:hypothetical protein